MKMKIVLIAIALMAIIGTMGAASAYNLRIYNDVGTAPALNPLDLLPGDSITLSLYMEKMVNDSDTFVINPAIVTALTSGATTGLSTDVTVLFTTGTLNPNNADPYIQNAEITITLANTAPIGAEYNIQISADGATSPMDLGLASRNVNTVPEFPTIALPVAAILGLAFFFQRRREEE